MLVVDLGLQKEIQDETNPRKKEAPSSQLMEVVAKVFGVEKSVVVGPKGWDQNLAGWG